MDFGRCNGLVLEVYLVVFDCLLHARVDGRAFPGELNQLFMLSELAPFGRDLVNFFELAIDVCEVLEDFVHCVLGYKNKL